jgi:hypothetical protein
VDRIKEREMYLEMLGDLVKQRRVLTEEILMVRNHLTKLDQEIEQHKEYMSAAEYINIRNSIRKELEVEMRQQVKQEIEAEQKPVVEEVQSVIPAQEMAEAKFHENQKSRKDVGAETIARVIKSYLQEAGRPVEFDDLYEFVQENRNHSWNRKAFSQLMWKVRQIDERIENPSRGYYQYR